MRLQPGERRACQACQAPMVGALTKDGKVAPIRLEPRPDGNVLLFLAAGPTGAQVVQARTFAGLVLDALREQGVPLRLNHFADCPHRERFARGGAS